MKQRIFAALLALTLLLGLCACAPTDPQPTQPSTTAPSQPATIAPTQPTTQPEDGKVTYRVSVTDENGNLLPNVMVQLCLTSCIPGSTGESGTAEFRLEEGAYHASVMIMPEGYAYIGTETEFYFEDGKTELTIVLQSPAAPTEPQPTEPKPTETKPTEPKPTEPKPTEPKPTEPNPTEPAPTDPTDPPEGTRENPLGCYPDASSNVSIATITLPELAGGTSIFCNVYRVGGRQITIESADVYVVYNGTRYTAKNGKVSFRVAEVMADRPLLMEIGNTGTKAATFVLKCQSPSGTFENPTELSAMDGKAQTLHLEEGDEQGYYYIYTAEKAGTLRLTLTQITGGKVAAELENLTSGGIVSNAQYNEFEGKDYVELTVSAGDEVRIHLSQYDDITWEIPATDVTWTGTIQ